MQQLVFALLLLLGLVPTQSAPQQSHSEALAAHRAAENAVRAAAGQAPHQAFSHEAAFAAHASAEQQAQSDCVYVDEEVCNTEKTTVCEDQTKWECNTATRIEEVGKDVEQCNPTTKTVCVPKTRYEPEEYMDNECTTTTELKCRTNYKTVLKTYKDEECRTTYEKKCSTVPRTEVDLTIELHCTCEVCTRVVVKRFCNGYNSCKEVTELRCNRGQARKTRSGCKNEVCEENKIHKTRTVEEERCIENPRETCYDVEKEKAEVVPVKDCNHVPTTQCKPVKKIRQKEIVYPDCHEVSDPGCKIVHIYEEIMVPFEDCKAVTKEVCDDKPNRVCKTIKTQVCGGH
jgi:hypothetical protein